MGRNVLNLWEKYYDATFPIKEGDGFIILGIDSFTASDAEAQLAQALEAVKPFHALKETVLNAESDEAKTIWDAREKLLLAIQKSTPKMDEVDVSVPINKIPLVLHRIEELEKEEDMRIPNFGHAGDGNLHIYLCSDDMTDEEFAKKGDNVISELYKTAKSVGGNMSGEHTGLATPARTTTKTSTARITPTCSERSRASSILRASLTQTRSSR